MTGHSFRTKLFLQSRRSANLRELSETGTPTLLTFAAFSRFCCNSVKKNWILAQNQSKQVKTLPSFPVVTNTTFCLWEVTSRQQEFPVWIGRDLERERQRWGVSPVGVASEPRNRQLVATNLKKFEKIGFYGGRNEKQPTRKTSETLGLLFLSKSKRQLFFLFFPNFQSLESQICCQTLSCALKILKQQEANGK